MPVVPIWEVSLGCILSLSQKKKKVNNTKNIAVKQVTVFLGLHVCVEQLCACRMIIIHLFTFSFI